MKQAKRLVKWKVEDLLPAGYNPRTITADALGRLEDGIEHFGLVQPIIVNKRTDTVVGGHQRLKVLASRGEEFTWVIEVDLNEFDEIALNVALNNPALSGAWDPVKLGELLTNLEAEDPELVVHTGYHREELGTLLRDLEKKAASETSRDQDVTPTSVSIGFSVKPDQHGFIEETLSKVDASKRGDALMRLCEHYAEKIEGIDFEPGQGRRKLKTIDKDAIDIREVNFALARKIVERYHYTKSWPPSATFVLGAFLKSRLLGIIVYGTGASPYLITAAFDNLDRKEGWELVRLFAWDWAPKNIESYLIGRSFAYIEKHRPDIRCVVSFADPGQGHMGTIYQATNWIYTGTTAGQYYAKIDGKLVHSRTYNELPLDERHELLDNEDNLVWQEGRHRYIYILGSKGQRKKTRRGLKYDVLPYPKAENKRP